MFYKCFWVKNIAEEKLWNCYQWKSNVADFIFFAWASQQESHLHLVSVNPPQGGSSGQAVLMTVCAHTQKTQSTSSHPRCGRQVHTAFPF